MESVEKAIGILSILALLSAGCVPELKKPEPSKSGPWKIGTYVEVEDVPHGFEIQNQNDSLASDNLFYTAWTSGKQQSIIIGNKETDYYDAQLYMLVQEADSAESSENNMANLLTRAESTYEISDEEKKTYNGRTWTVLTYTYKSEDTPYAHGISALTAAEHATVLVELSMTDAFAEDGSEALAYVLDRCKVEE